MGRENFPRIFIAPIKAVRSVRYMLSQRCFPVLLTSAGSSFQEYLRLAFSRRTTVVLDLVREVEASSTDSLSFAAQAFALVVINSQQGGRAMKKQALNYDTLLKITRVISHSKDPEEVVLLAVESIKTALGFKGCATFLINRQTNELELAASFGLSEEYLNKGPLNALRSIAQSLEEGPVAIYDVTDDPRIQYPEEARKEGIASMLSVPIVIGGQSIGVLRVYTSEPWEFTLDDVNFIQAMASMSGMAIEMARNYKGMKDSIEVLKQLRDPKTIKYKRRTPYEGVPVSVSRDKS